MSEAPPQSGAAPTLSILCLTFNHEAFVTQALESFLAQVTLFPIEVVISDDASTDSTLAIVEQFAQRAGPQWRILRSPVNTGVTRNFRRAMSACRGRYIALCEGDDFWRGHDKLQVQVDFLEAHPDHVLTYHDATVMDQHGKMHGVQLPHALQRDATQAELMSTRPISTLTACFRHVLPALPPELDHAPALDLCLWSLLGQHGRGKYMPDIEPAVYRVHGGGVFSMQDERNRQLMTAQTLLCLARLYARTEKPALRQELQESAAIMVSRSLSAMGGMRVGSAAFRLQLLRAARWLMTRWTRQTR